MMTVVVDQRQARRWRLLASSGIAATALGATLTPAHAAGPSAFSPAWYAQRSAQTGTAATGAPAPIGLTAAQQQQIDTSRANLTRAADALRAARTLQSTAQAAVRAAGFARSDGRVVTDGLGRSGLYYARGATAGDSYDVTTAAARSGAATANGLVWQGAELPTEKANTDIVAGTTSTGTGAAAVTTPNGKLVEAAAAGNTLVTVKQTAAKAILTWQNFDVGAHTTLYFNQTSADGTPQRNWVALNRVLAGAPGADGSRVQARPSLILGKIRGDGEIYVINQNGVIFGQGSQVNTNSVTASALDVGMPFQNLAERNDYFLTNTTGRNSFSFQYLLETDPEKIKLYGRLKLVFKDDPDSSFTTNVRLNNRNGTRRTYAATIAEDAVEGSVVVEAGAEIVTGSLGTDGKPLGLNASNTSLGRVVLAAPNVINAGSVRSDDGQVILVGARNYSLYANDGLSGKAIDPNVRGVLVEAGQQDLTSVAVNTTTGAARPNPFITRSIATTIFGNFPVGVSPQQGTGTQVVIGIAQGGTNYDRSKSNTGLAGETNRFTVQFDSRNRPFIVQPLFYNTEGLATNYAGTVINTGLASAPRGSIIARGNSIAQQGILHATTSVNQAGLIDLKASNVSSATITGGADFLRPDYSNRLGVITFAGGAITTILPDDQAQADGTQKTIPSDALSLASFRPSAVNISTENTIVRTSADPAAALGLPDTDRYLGNFGVNPGDALGQITANDGAVTFAAGSLLEVPSGNISIKSAAPVQLITLDTYSPVGGGQAVPDAGGGVVVLPAGIVAGITVAGEAIDKGKVTPGAIIDASGLANVVLPVESNVIVVARVGQNELADSPLQRDGFIYRQRNILIDRRLSGVRDDGFAWVGTPLFDASGYVNARGQLVTERMLTGGTIAFSGAVVTGRNSLLNVAGGLLTFAEGSVATTQLITADGRRTVDIGRADPLIAYSGFAGQFVEDHGKWNVTTTYSGLGLATAASQFEASYVEGANAGRITFSGVAQSVPVSSPIGTQTSTPASGRALTALDGNIAGGAVTGPYQRQGSAYGRPAPRGGTLDLSQVLTSTVTIANASDIAVRRAAAPADFLPATLLPGEAIAPGVFLNQYWSTEALAASGLADISFGSSGFARTYQGFDQPIGSTRLISIGADANPLANAAAFGATTLTLPDGGNLRLTAQDILVGGNLVAHAGSVTATLVSKRFVDADYIPTGIIAPGQPQYQPTTAALPRSTFTLAAGSSIDLSGRFVNDLNATRDSLVGYDFVNAGTLTVASTSILNTVEFATGSRVDLTSSGYVTATGRLGTTGSAGLGRGRGGNLSIELTRLARGYVPLSPATDPLLTPEIEVADIREQIDSSLILGGSIDATGFQGGGTFMLTTPELVIGAGTDGTVRGLTTLTPEFFTGHGFGSFALTALLTARIDDGVTLALNQQQFLPTGLVATATSRDDAAVRGQYAAGSLQRTAVNLSLTARGYTDFNSHVIADRDADDIAVLIPKGPSHTADNALTLGAGAAIAGDPLAQITLAATGQMRLGVDGKGGGITAAGGSITISQRFGFVSGVGSFIYGPAVPTSGTTYASPSYETGIIAAGFAIDASGVLLSDLRAVDQRVGTVLNGGTVSIDGGLLSADGLPTGAIFGRTGSSIDVGGATGIVDLPVDALTRSFEATTVASNGGTLRLNGATLLSTLHGGGGDGHATGGTIDINATGIIKAVGIDIDALAPLAAPVALAGGSLLSQGALVPAYVDGTGFDALFVRGGAIVYDDVSIAVDRSIILVSGGLSWQSTTAVPGTGRAQVRLSAPYIRLQNSDNRGLSTTSVGAADPSTVVLPPLPGGSSGTVARADLTLAADTIDLSGQHSTTGFATTTLAATADIRFVPELLANTTGLGGTYAEYTTNFIAAGDLTLSAAQVYPSTAVSATIGARFLNGLTASGANSGTITILGNAQSAGTAAPLSVGGRLIFDAGHIVQRGTIRAPLGQISFGVPGGGTQTVETFAGSLTSVSANGLLVPYGTTVNGSQYFYTALSGSPLTSAPAKAITIAAGAALLDQGAALDLSGGGDLYATEFIPGLGGQRNVLTTSLSADAGAAVYAILPGQQPLVAPVDPNGYSNLVPDVPGQTLTLLSDAGGLKAGTYTLYAGSYATLPGAYRVQALPSTGDLPGGANSTLADGSVVVAGRLGLNGTEYAASRTAGYRVFDDAAWRQYSQIVTTTGGKFFAGQAAAAGVAPAPLPADAGRLSIAVSAVEQALRAQAQLNFGVAAGGRGGQVDIAAARIAVVSSALQAGLEAELAGFVVLSPAEVRGFNAASVLLGATRVTDFGGDYLTPVADSIRIATTAADALTNPELLFVTTGGAANIVNTITVDAGSVIAASGAFAGQPAGTIRFGQTNRFDVSGNRQPDLIGDGNLLRLSNGGAVNVVRIAPNPTPLGIIAIASTATAPTRIDGGKALQLDAGRDLRIDATTTLTGASADLHGQQIRFGDTPSTGDAVIDGSALTQLLAGAQQLTLRADQRIVFDRPTLLGGPTLSRLRLETPVIASTGDVTLAATTIVLGNAYALPAGVTAAGGTATLTTSSDNLVLTGRDRVFQGFDRFDFNAAKSVSIGDDKVKGSLTLPGIVTITSPLIQLADGSDQTLAVAGTFTAQRSGSPTALPATTSVGGKLTLDVGGGVAIANTIAAVAGLLDIRSRDGDIVISDGALLSAKGFTQTFVDKQVVAAGGTIKLAADSGTVRFAGGSTVSVAADPHGNAGSLGITIGATGDFVFAGTLSGAGGGGTALGGQFFLASNGAVVLEPLAQKLVAGGFTGAIDVRSGIGNLELTNTSLIARTIALTADDRTAGGGLVDVATTLDASGPDGGTITLYGQRGVTLAATAVLRAVATAPAVEDRGGRGGSVTIGTGVLSPDNVVQDQGGVITLAAGSQIDVSDAFVNGVSTYGANRGGGGASVSIRAPIIAGDVAVTLGSTITGARTVSLEAYRRFTTQNSAFDGIVDPAGWFEADGGYVQGTWTDPYGGIVQPGLAQTGTGELTEASYFSPVTYDPHTGAVTDHSNAAHVAFYQQTLVDFVQSPGFDAGKFAGVAGLHVQPGVELVNSDLAVNGGNISVLSNWNLGAGSAADALIYRTAAGAEPGVLTLRATGNIDVKASISDGFFRTTRYNPYSAFDYTYGRLLYTSYFDAGLTGSRVVAPRFPARFGQKIGDPPSLEASQYYHDYAYYADRLYTAFADVIALTGPTVRPGGPGAAGAVPFPTNIVDPAVNYQAYTVGYQQYLSESIDAYNAAQALRGAAAHYRRPLPPEEAPDEAGYPSYAANYFAYINKIKEYNDVYSPIGAQLIAFAVRPAFPPAVVDTPANVAFNRQVVNDIANNATAGDPLPIASSDLMTSGTSWSYRLIAGSDTASVNPNLLHGADVVVSGSGNVTIGTAALTAATSTGSGVVVRTGTGSIGIAAAGDVRWINGNDTVYTAGIDAGAVAGFVDTGKVARIEFNPPTPDGSLIADNAEVIAGQAQTPGVFGRRGGDVTILARGSLVGAPERGLTLTGFRDPIFANDPQGFDGIEGPMHAGTYLTSSGARRSVTGWLFQQGVSSDQPALFGQFGGSSDRDQVVGPPVSVPSLQSAEWVRTGRFAGTVATLGGGNVTLDAGDDITDASVFLISTLQASGGKSAGEAVTVTHFGGGDLVAHAGGDISGATVLISRGNSRIVADGALIQPLQSVLAFDQGQFDEVNAGFITNLREPVAAAIRNASLLASDVAIFNSFTVENGNLSITARGDVAIAPLNQAVASDLSYDEVDRGQGNGTFVIPQVGAAFTQLGVLSSTDVRSLTGTLAYAPIAQTLSAGGDGTAALTPTLTLAALRGDLTINGALALAPSPTGTLDLLANGSIFYSYRPASSPTLPGITDPAGGPLIRMDDRDQSQIATVERPQAGSGTVTPDRFGLHAPSAQPLHLADAESSHIIALTGDLTTGAGLATRPVAGIAPGAVTSISLAESAIIFAGNDIVDMRFTGQNSSAQGITSITAGRDITYTLIGGIAPGGGALALPAGGTYTIGGEGTLALIAGRNLSLATGLPPRLVIGPVDGRLVTAPGIAQGALAVGNDLNPYLAARSADIEVLFGVGPTVNQPGNAGIADFVSTYIDPANAATLPTDYGQALLDFVNARLIRRAQQIDPATSYAGIVSRPPSERPDPAKPDPIAVASAYQQFAALDPAQQRGLVEMIFFSELRAISQTSDLAQYLNYPRAYAAIDTLFPATAGYTDNFTVLDANGQPQFDGNGNPLLPTLRHTGEFDMVDSLVQTSFGSGINILGPGGSAVLGGLNVTASFASQGVLTLRGGAINIFTDGSLTVNNSRIFTLQGGDETIFATNGNIDAGRGKRTASFLPPLVVSYLPTTAAIVNFGGLVSGAGIGTLQTLPGSAAADIFLLAPRGDIDAGDAGIRSSGNLSIVANQVLNGDNLTVKGATSGVPQAPTVSATAVASASNTSAAAGETDTAAAQRPLDQQAVITVQVTGCSDDDTATGRCARP